MAAFSEVVAAVDRIARAFVEDPVDAAIAVRERLAERHEMRAKREHGGGFMPWPPCPYEEDADWERSLHAELGAPWPCPDAGGFAELWHEVIATLRARGVAPGRGAFAGWGDGEPGFVRAVWCIVRHSRPTAVVETGVARGITSRFVLEALEANGVGRLWSIDLPPRGRRELHEQVGAAVPEKLRGRWSYVKGSSRRRLHGLLDELGRIDVFVHDSKHTERNLLFELERARRALRDGGCMAADDVDLNCGLHRYRASHPDDRVLVCAAEPLEPDPGRQNDRGVFAVITPHG
jgi:Methyltransferase domain